MEKGFVDTLYHKRRDAQKKLLEVKAEAASIEERVEDIYEKMPEDEFRRAHDKCRHLRAEQLKLEQDLCDIDCSLSIEEWKR